MKNIVVLTGAGMSAESGIKTFRDADGTWENHRIEDVATPEAWRKNKPLVLDFYNQRRQNLLEVNPNEGHLALVKLEEKFNVDIITQNVDDLHERAGSSNVLHLHGELLKVRSIENPNLIYEWKKDLLQSDKNELGHTLRPHIVWFGEDVPMILDAVKLVQKADYIIVIGTSMVVYPAAGLVYEAPYLAPIYVINPDEKSSPKDIRKIDFRQQTATVGVPLLVDELIQALC